MKTKYCKCGTAIAVVGGKCANCNYTDTWSWWSRYANRQLDPRKPTPPSNRGQRVVEK